MMMKHSYVFSLFLFVALCLSFTTLFIGLNNTIRYEGRTDHDPSSDGTDYEDFRGVGRPIDLGHQHDAEDNSLSRRLYHSVRVLGWIMTSPKNLEKKATAVKNTWAPKFNHHLFFSSETNETFPTIGLNVAEGRQHLTAKTMKGFKYVHDHFLEEADWFMKADDDTYVIVENLRYFLSHFDPQEPIYFGFHFRPFTKQGYMSGGAGYVLSNKALRMLVKSGISNSSNCRQDGGAEDAEIGRCLYKIGIKAGSSVDKYGRETFHPFKPIAHMEGHYPDWYYKYAYNKVQKGLGCCSDYSITFHYIPPADMYLLHYLIYHLRPYGVNVMPPSSAMFNQPISPQPTRLSN